MHDGLDLSTPVYHAKPQEMFGCMDGSASNFFVDPSMKWVFMKWVFLIRDALVTGIKIDILVTPASFWATTNFQKNHYI